MKVKERSRTQNSFINFIASFGGQMVNIILKFVVRTVFIRTLGRQYLGIGGLFDNILTMLSLADLGIGSAIVFKLYDPLAKKDEKRIAQLMNFYKKAYLYIGVAVLLMGLLLIPFLPVLIRDYDSLKGLNINAVAVFLIYLSNSVSTYLFFAYKISIIHADQKEYINTIVEYLFYVVVAIFQIILLLVYPNFLVYAASNIVRTIFKNIVVAKIADKLYPYINQKTEPISKEETKGIFKDCGALFIYKANDVVVKSTDNIVLSAYLGLDKVALYSNYLIFYTTIRLVFQKLTDAFAHSLGNLHTTNDLDHEYDIFRVTMLISAIMGGVALTGITVCADEFITCWIGSDWVIAKPFSLLMGLELYTAALKLTMSKHRNAMGLFQQKKFMPLVSMIVNVAVSILLVKPLGIVGVLIGTIASDWTTFVWYDPMVVHIYGYKSKFSLVKYFVRFFKYLIASVASVMVSTFICQYVILASGWLTLILHAIICTIITISMIMISAVGTYEFNYLLGYMKKIIKKITRR